MIDRKDLVKTLILVDGLISKYNKEIKKYIVEKDYIKVYFNDSKCKKFKLNDYFN